MTSISSIARSGLQAAQTSLDASASNVANLDTPNYHRRQVVQTTQPDGGVSASVTTASEPGGALETDLVAQLQAKNAFLANIAVFKTSANLAGALLDEKA